MRAAPAQAGRGVSAGLLPHLALAALVLLQLWLIATHVAWRDELQAVLIAQHSVSVPDLFARLHYEGHPALYYLLLRPLAALGDPLASLKLVQAAAALATMAIVWLRAPFGPWLRLTVLAGYLMLFEWGTIARSYEIGVLLFFAFLALRRHFAAWVCIALMANVSAHFAMLAAACVAVLVIVEGQRSVAGVAVALLGSAAALATALPAPDVAAAVPLVEMVAGRFLIALAHVGEVLVPVDPSAMPPGRKGFAPPAGAFLGLVVVTAVYVAARRVPRLAAIGAALACAVVAMGTFVYPVWLRHTGVLFLFLIAAEWIAADRGAARQSPAAVALIAVQALFGAWIAAWALFVPYTPAAKLQGLAGRGAVACAGAVGGLSAVDRGRSRRPAASPVSRPAPRLSGLVPGVDRRQPPSPCGRRGAGADARLRGTLAAPAAAAHRLPAARRVGTGHAGGDGISPSPAWRKLPCGRTGGPARPRGAVRHPGLPLRRRSGAAQHATTFTARPPFEVSL